VSKSQYLLGLTGSVGMGKSTTAQMFRELGIPVWDADQTVHDLYDEGGAAVALIGALSPSAITNGKVDRAKLRTMIRQNPELLKRVEALIHPLLTQYRAAFTRSHPAARILVFDMPLLFETGSETWLDGVLVVTAPAEMQRSRVISRPTMDQGGFDALTARQMPDAEKRGRADFVIDTSLGMDHAREKVQELANRLAGS
jgi:dephospho-CoA kinase